MLAPQIILMFLKGSKRFGTRTKGPESNRGKGHE